MDQPSSDKRTLHQAISEADTDLRRAMLATLAVGNTSCPPGNAVRVLPTYRNAHICALMNMRAGASSRPAPVAAASMFRALSDPTRLRIVHLLREGPLCVGDLVTVLGIPQPAASRHLAYLRRAGLVEDERRGTWSFYALAGPTAPFHA
jgi:hypothetical protein